MVLEFTWFTIFVILITGYALLDGFDLGVGILHLFSKKDEERRLMLNSIGPIWDGNEVWLVTAGGALFAGFPNIYATLCSSFYLLVMLLLSGIIFRAVAIEFRSKHSHPLWRWMWDIFFSLASLIIALELGIILGNLIQGIPLDVNGEFIGDFYSIINPYSLLIGTLTVALFTMHGGIYLLLKTEGELHERVRKWINPTIIFFIMCYAVSTAATLIYQPHMVEKVKTEWFYFIIAIVNMFAIANIPREVHHNRDARAFACSCLNIICLFILYGIGTYPIVIRAINDPALSLTIYNSASSQLTLQILLTMAIIGVPLVLSYTAIIYWVFRGKVRLDSHSY